VAHTARHDAPCRYGGIYADLDLKAIADVAPMLRGHRLLLPRTANLGLTNAMMAATPGHPFVEYALHELPRFSKRWYHLTRHNTILSSTGSTFVWAAHIRWERLAMRNETAAILSPADWGKPSLCNWSAPCVAGSAAEARECAAAGRPPPFEHLQGSSWHKRDSELAIVVLCFTSEIVVVVGSLVVWLCCSHAKSAALLMLFLALVLFALRAAGIAREMAFMEAVLARPWIWLIMG
jgi:hypothetical protein